MKELPQAKLKRKSKSKLSIVHKRVQRSTELNPTDVGDSIVWCWSCVILETLLNLSVPQQPHHCKTVVITTLARGAWWRLNGNSQKAPTSQVRNKSSWTCVSCLYPSLYFLSSLTLLLPHFFKFSKCELFLLLLPNHLMIVLWWWLLKFSSPCIMYFLQAYLICFGFYHAINNPQMITVCWMYMSHH